MEEDKFKIRVEKGSKEGLITIVVLDGEEEVERFEDRIDDIGLYEYARQHGAS